jgi:hypothetical protein
VRVNNNNNSKKAFDFWKFNEDCGHKLYHAYKFYGANEN